jgi:large subunit ribosomal protein L9
VNVKDGYARHLITRKQAIEATAQNKNDRKTQIEAKDYHAQVELDQAKALAKQLDGKSVCVHAKAGVNGKLFGSVTAKEIAAAISDSCNQSIDKRKVVLKSEIKAFGIYSCEVKLHTGVSATMQVEVVE